MFCIENYVLNYRIIKMCKKEINFCKSIYKTVFALYISSCSSVNAHVSRGINNIFRDKHPISLVSGIISQDNLWMGC